MSEILVDNLTGKTSAGDITVTSEGGAATQSLQQGLAKAWVNFSGEGTIATRDSLNVGSLTDNTTGDYTVNYTNNMNNANYNSACTGSWNGDVARGSLFGFGANTANMTTSTIRTHCLQSGNYGAFDGTILCVDTKGDLA